MKLKLKFDTDYDVAHTISAVIRAVMETEEKKAHTVQIDYSDMNYVILTVDDSVDYQPQQTATPTIKVEGNIVHDVLNILEKSIDTTSLPLTAGLWWRRKGKKYIIGMEIWRQHP